MVNLCDKPITKNEIADALKGAKLLLSILDMKHKSVSEVLETVYKRWGRFGDIEINGRYTYRNCVLPIPEEDIEFIRIECFGEPGVKGDIMYCYISTGKFDNGTMKFLPETLVFDYYPWESVNDYIATLAVDDCEKILSGKTKIPARPENVLITM